MRLALCDLWMQQEACDMGPLQRAILKLTSVPALNTCVASGLSAKVLSRRSMHCALGVFLKLAGKLSACFLGPSLCMLVVLAHLGKQELMSAMSIDCRMMGLSAEMLLLPIIATGCVLGYLGTARCSWHFSCRS